MQRASIPGFKRERLILRSKTRGRITCPLVVNMKVPLVNRLHGGRRDVAMVDDTANGAHAWYKLLLVQHCNGASSVPVGLREGDPCSGALSVGRRCA